MFWTFSKKGKKQQVIKTSLCKSLKKHCQPMCKRTLNRYEFSYALLSILRGGSFHHLLYDTFWTGHTMLMIYCELKSSKVDIRLYNYTHTHTHTQNEIASGRTLAQTWYSELSNQSGIKWTTCGYNWSDGGRNSSEIKQKNQIANAFYAISRSIHRLIKACCQFARAVSSMTASVTTSLKYRVSNIFWGSSWAWESSEPRCSRLPRLGSKTEEESKKSPLPFGKKLQILGTSQNGKVLSWSN